MDYDEYFTPRTRALRPVEIREVASLVQGRDVVSLAAGWPSPESFPVELLDELVGDAMAEAGREMLQYGSTVGLQSLRESLAARTAERTGVDVAAENVLVTAGSQQGLYLLSRAFVDDGTEIAVGAPTYVAALTAFGSYREPALLEVSLDDDGLDVARLEDLLDDHDPRFVYAVPTFQNPTGVTMSAERRRRLAELAREHDFLVVEDGPYDDLCFEGEPPAPIYGAAPERTVYLGTFSKVLAPGLRIGWLVAPADVVRKLELVKQPVDLHANTFGQHVAVRYLASGAIDDQVAHIRELYRRRRDVALEALAASMPDGVEWTRPAGGMFVWVTLPSGYDARAMLPTAVDEGVAYVPGGPFYAGDGAPNTLRLTYSFADEGDLRTGIERLAETVREHEP